MDWKHKKVHECSCDPTRLGNYFVESDLPFETSPAFFRPEVLLKYKSDPDKYRIERRSIRCRGAWSLKSFDINEAGQIHVYLCDLNKLPFPEQLYWKSFNEEPKTGISERAFTTDFLGEWDSAPDPLVILKRLLQSLNKQDVPWWSLKDPQLLDRVSYVVTSSKEEWANEIMVLDQLLIEGFNKSYFKTKAKEFGITVDPTWSSLKLIVELLKKGQIDEVDITTIVSPLRSLHELRNKMKGHAPGAEARKIRETIISKHGDLKAHFRFLVHQCERAFSLLTEFGNSNNIF